MLTVLFILAVAVLIASLFRRPATLWHRAAVAVAAVLAVAVCVAWVLEYMMQTAL